MTIRDTLTDEARVDDAVKPDVSVERPSGADSPTFWQSRWTVLGAQIALVLVVGGAWELLSRLSVLPVIYVSEPSAILVALYQGLAGGPMLGALGLTLLETITGFVIASILGVLVGVAIYEIPFLEKILRPFITALNNLPRLALTPLFVLSLGVGFVSHVSLVVTMVFFVVLLNTYAGFQTTDRDYLLLAKVLGTSRWKLFRDFIFPAATPTIFVGLQLGLTYSFMGAVIGEIITGGTGLGALVSTYSATYNSAAVFALLLLMALVATAMSIAVRSVEMSLLRWRKFEQRGLTKS